jgi:oxidoreductase AflX
MPSYAILGATGNTGRALYQYLSTSPDNTLKLYARSESKLLEQNPSLSTPPPNIQLFTGPLTDTELIASCIKDVDIVFCVLATNLNTSGCHIAQDSAHAVLAALEVLKTSSDGKAPLPRLVILSAMPVSKKLERSIPTLVKKMLWASFGHVYRDLEAAEAILSKEKSWLKATFVYPGGISEIDDRALGYEISTEHGGTPGFISYPDLARGMVEIADDKEGKYEWVDVTVSPTGKGVRMAYGRQLRILSWNTLRGALPFLYGKN